MIIFIKSLLLEQRNYVNLKEYRISDGRQMKVSSKVAPMTLPECDPDIENETDHILSLMKDNELFQELELREKTIADRKREQ